MFRFIACYLLKLSVFTSLLPCDHKLTCLGAIIGHGYPGDVINISVRVL